MPIPKFCPKCSGNIKLVPAGISKRTGKPYSEFYACENRDCDFTCYPPRQKGQTGGTEAIVREGDQGEMILKKLDEIEEHQKRAEKRILVNKSLLERILGVDNKEQLT